MLCAYRPKTNCNVKVLDFVGDGGLDLTVGITIFELRMSLCQWRRHVATLEISTAIRRTESMEFSIPTLSQGRQLPPF